MVPDQGTGNAVAIAIGQSALYADKVEIGVETVIKYDVTRPNAFSRIQLS